ncbi:hypothetical protein ACROYT_G014632 [Oculina patagonica]
MRPTLPITSCPPKSQSVPSPDISPKFGKKWTITELRTDEDPFPISKKRKIRETTVGLMEQMRKVCDAEDENAKDFTSLPSSKVKFAKDLNGENLLVLLGFLLLWEKDEDHDFNLASQGIVVELCVFCLAMRGCCCDLGRHKICLEPFLQTKANISGCSQATFPLHTTPFMSSTSSQSTLPLPTTSFTPITSNQGTFPVPTTLFMPSTSSQLTLSLPTTSTMYIFLSALYAKAKGQYLRVSLPVHALFQTRPLPEAMPKKIPEEALTAAVNLVQLCNFHAAIIAGRDVADGRINQQTTPEPELTHPQKAPAVRPDATRSKCQCISHDKQQ